MDSTQEERDRFSPISTDRSFRLLSTKDESKFKLGLDLTQLSEEYEDFVEQGGSDDFEPSNPLIQVGDNIEDTVDIPVVAIEAVASGETDVLLSDLEALGLQNSVSFGRIVNGLLPLDALESLEELNTLQFVRPVYQPLTNIGATTSQADVSMRSDIARSTFGVDGSGVTVGVLSDSYNALGGAGTDVLTGDLPGVGNPFGNTTPVNVLLDDFFFFNIDEGRGMLQLVHDVAPGADLAFHTASLGQASFAQGILDLAAAGSDVIVDDIIYLAEPMFQDGIIAQAVDQVVSNSSAYFSSAGNQERRSYESAFVSSGIPDPAGGVYHDFDPSAGIDILQGLTIPVGEDIAIAFQWDSPFFSVSGGTGSPNDLNI